jgi:hypothetical protein
VWFASGKNQTPGNSTFPQHASTKKHITTKHDKHRQKAPLILQHTAIIIHVQTKISHANKADSTVSDTT